MKNKNYFINIVAFIILVINFIRIIKVMIYFMASIIHFLNKRLLLSVVICVCYNFLVGRGSMF